jgi:uncharacterized membrane protein
MTDGQPSRQGERRLPMALAVLTAAALYLFIPADFRLNDTARAIYPVLLLGLLLILVIGDPGRIDRDQRWLRIVTGLLILTITLATAISVVRVVVGILHNANFASPSELLAIGAIVWVNNVIAFTLWYWHLDSGGPAARASGRQITRPAFHFPEEDHPDQVWPGWYPQFIDYLALSFNTATAFSPTDVSAIRHWAKLMLILESAISLTLVALVVARAINIL